MATIDLTIPLSFGDTLGSLMHAVIEAQAQAARATVEFIQDVGTIEGATDIEGSHKLRNVKFNYYKLDENAKAREFTLEVPLLSMVEVPLINVKTAKFSFKYDITSTKESTEEEQPADVKTTTGGGVTLGKMLKPIPIKKSAQLKGRIQRTSKTTTNETGGMTVEIELEKSALPVGLERIMDMLELAASETPTNTETPPPDNG